MIEVGEYVRTKSGIITKVVEIKPTYFNDNLVENECYIYCNKYFKQWKMWQLEEIITKHSKNITDILENGDYVNGYYVLEIKDNKIIVENGARINGEEELNQQQIETIVTKEMFESIEYEV